MNMKTTSETDLTKFDDIDLLYPSMYLKAADLRGRDVTVTIEAIEPRHELKNRTGKSDWKPVLRLAKTDKLLVCNKTNATIISELYGRKPSEWVGKSITLYPTDVQVGREMKPAIRVRTSSPKAPTKASSEPATGTASAEYVYGGGES
jgi:hypothetical protein